MAAVGILGGVGLVGAGMMSDGSGGTFSFANLGNAARRALPAGPSPEELAAQEREKRAKELNAELTKYAATVPEFSVAVLDRKTGQKYSFRGTEKYDTASVVKVQVLACLLLDAQDDDRELTANQLALARKMITLSDNDATTSLFNSLGKQSAITACNKRLGLSQTAVNAAWGLTRTTVDDQLRLLAELVDAKGPLDADSRKLAYTLMSSVDPAQEWGVPVVARTGEKFTVKNGWDTRTKDNGLWVINSVGRVTGGSTDVSIAVLSRGHTAMPDGIAVVEKVAKLSRQYLKY